MNRIEYAFKNKAFIPFFSAGDPDIETSEKIIMSAIEAGADLVEIGIPFSDPIAEGPVIQQSSLRALKAGISVEKIFSLVENLRQKTDVALVFMTYINPVFNYGCDNFFKKCSEIGIDGIIIPDLPYEERDEVAEFTKKYNIALIPLVAPTSKDRIEKIAKSAEGFVYVVSSMGVTGIRNEFTTDLDSIVEIVRSATDVPPAIGFGISKPEHAKKFSKIADGVIVGSALEKIIEEHGQSAPQHVFNFVKSMKNAMENE